MPDKGILIMLILGIVLAIAYLAWSFFINRKSSQTVVLLADAGLIFLSIGAIMTCLQLRNQYIYQENQDSLSQENPASQLIEEQREVQTPTPTATLAPTQTPAEIPTQTPAENPTQIPAEAPTQTPAEVPTQTPAEVPTQTPAEVPTQTPAEVPIQTPAEVPTQTPAEDPTPDPAGEPEVQNEGNGQEDQTNQPSETTEGLVVPVESNGETGSQEGQAAVSQ